MSKHDHTPDLPPYAVEDLVDPQRADTYKTDIDRKAPAELQDMSKQLGVHLLLSVTLKHDNQFEQKVLNRVHSELGFNTTPKTHQARRTGINWSLWLALLGGSGLLIFVLVMSQSSAPQLWLKADTGWHSPVAQQWGQRIEVADIPQRLTVGHYTYDLSRFSILHLPADAAGLSVLKQGTATLSTDFGDVHVELALPEAVLRAQGRVAITVGPFRQRLQVFSGTAEWFNQQGDRQMMSAGTQWDIPRSGVPQAMQLTDAARMAMTLDEHVPLGPSLIQSRHAIHTSMQVTPHVPFDIPFMPPPAYDVQLELSRQAGEDVVVLQVPHMSGIPGLLMLDGWKSSRHGFFLVGGEHDQFNASTSWAGALLPVRTTVRLDIRVRDELIIAYADGHLLSWYHMTDDIPNILWPPKDNNHVRLIPREDAFDVMQVSCRIHADGIGASNHMYGPQ